MQQRSASSTTKTIGLFLADIDETVGYRTYQGVSQRARELGFNTYCFVQGTRSEPEFTNLCTAMALPQLDGIICGIFSRTCLMSSAELQSYFEQFQLPLVSVGELWEGHPCILFDNYQGMREALTHLIEVHGKRRIFLIRGPLNHRESTERYQAYLDVMAEYGLFDPVLISAPADWRPNLKENIQQVFGLLRPGIDFDTIMSSNDAWAIEAIRFLQEEGFEIPEQLTVVGFNDSKQGQNLSPPLTSVHLSFFEKGRRAVDALHELMNGNVLPMQAELPTRLEIRKSCGCLESDMVKEGLRQYLDSCEGSSTNIANEAGIIEYIRQFLQDENLVAAINYIEPIVKVIKTLGDQGSEAEFLQLVTKAARNSIQKNQDVITWWNTLEILMNWGLKGPCSLPQDSLELLFRRAQAILGFRMIEKSQCQAVIDKENFWRLYLLIHYLIQIFDLDQLVAFLAQKLPEFGFYSSYLVLYNNGQPYIHPGAKPVFSSLVLAYNGTQPEVIQTDAAVFPATDFLPESCMPPTPFSLVVTPLYTQEYQYGYMVSDYKESSPLAYKMFFPQLKACLRGIHFFNQRKKAEEVLKLQKEELARSNDELQQFASVASHDLQEPLRKIITFGNRLRTTYLESLPEQARDYLNRIDNAAFRMQSLISDLLNYSRVTSKAKPFTRIDLGEIVRDVLTDIEVKINETKAQITISPLPQIEADPLQMRQLFQNMISNGIKFQKKDGIPRINISAEVNGNFLTLIFEDNGIGINPIYHERIFMVFERLHNRSEYEGTGIGLAICKKIVDRHHGTIRIENGHQCGTRFIVRLPIGQDVNE